MFRNVLGSGLAEAEVKQIEVVHDGPGQREQSESRRAQLVDHDRRCEHRQPDLVADYCANARLRGLRVIIAGAGLSAALPGVAAAHTDLPVIGVPLSSRLSAMGGLDAILSVVQMPPGVPVASVGLDNAKNAGHLALRILRA